MAVLAFGTIIPALAYAQPRAVSGSDWEYLHGNSWGHNNSPQTQINSGNVDQLEVKWVFPVPGSSTAPALIVNLPGLYQGANTPPIVNDGLVYITTGSLTTYAINAETGKQVWSYQYQVDLDDAADRLPIDPAGPHLHGIQYWAGEDALILPGLACDYRVVDAKTGQEKFTIGPWCQTDIPGSIYKYRGWKMNLGTATLGIYEEGRLFIGGQGGTEPGTYKEGRGLVWAIDIDNPSRIVWRVFNQPPQDLPVDDWAMQECDVGWFYTVPCSQVREQSPENLMNDWQMNPGEAPHWSTGTTSMWGQPIVDEDTGFVYLNTGNVSPFFYTEYRPGPNLYSATIQAIDMNTGQRAWWVQDVPRDPWDYDCNWSGMLIDDPTLGKVYVKGCKIGFLHVRNALTGEPIHYIDVRQDMDPRQGTIRTDQLGAKEPLDVLDTFLMKEWVMRESYPAPPGLMLVPGWFHGTFGSDKSYNDGTVFHYVQSLQVNIQEWLWPALPEVQETEGMTQSRTSWPLGNASIIARDLVTGDVKWRTFYPWSNIRAFLTVTGGMVIAPQPDGMMRFYDEDNGDVLRELNLAGPMIVGATVGQDNDGNSKIFAMLGNPSFGGPGFEVGPNIPGTLVALGLSERAAAEVRTTTRTVTTTARTTVTTTSATTITTATTRTVTTTSATTITSTIAPQTVTSTTTAPARTVTSTEEVSVGLPSEVTYAAVGIAVIAIIAAAALVMRKK